MINIFLLFLISSTLYCQTYKHNINQFINTQKRISVSERIVEFDIGYKFEEKILFETDEKNLYYTYNNIINCKLDFIKYNYANKLSDTISINIPEVGKLNCINSDKQIDDYYISNDTLFVKYRYSIFIYKIESTVTKLVKSIYLDQIIRRGSNDNRVGYKFQKYNNKIIGYLDIYIEHSLVNNNLFIWSYDFENNKLDTISIPQPVGYRWTQIQAKNIVDYKFGKLVTCDLEQDNLYLINSKDSIEKIKLGIFKNNWTIENQLEINHPQEFFNLNHKILDSMYLIHSVNFLDKDNILVKYSIPKTFETDLFSIFNFCILSKINNKWIIKNPVNPELIFGDNRIEDKRIYGYYYLVSHGKLISKHFSSFYDRNEKSFIRVENTQDVLDRIKSSVKYLK